MSDARTHRFEQAVIALVLLVGFVFGVWWTIPLTALLLVPGLLFGPARGPLPVLFTTVVAPRVGPRNPAVRARGRGAPAVETAVLGAATLVALAGASALAWVPGLLIAGLAAFDGAAGICLLCEAFRHFVG